MLDFDSMIKASQDLDKPSYSSGYCNAKLKPEIVSKVEGTLVVTFDGFKITVFANNRAMLKHHGKSRRAMSSFTGTTYMSKTVANCMLVEDHEGKNPEVYINLGGEFKNQEVVIHECIHAGQQFAIVHETKSMEPEAYIGSRLGLLVLKEFEDFEDDNDVLSIEQTFPDNVVRFPSFSKWSSLPDMDALDRAIYGSAAGKYEPKKKSKNVGKADWKTCPWTGRRK